MEFAIGAIIGAVIGLLFMRRKPHKSELTPVETEDQRKSRESDEIITVKLPTINHEK